LHVRGAVEGRLLPVLWPHKRGLIHAAVRSRVGLNPLAAKGAAGRHGRVGEPQTSIMSNAQDIDRSSELVTVIIPAYNAEVTLNETLLSVRRQTHSNLEIIVVDDGSRDGTADIAARHAASDARVSVIRQINRGVGAARNTALKNARGRFVAPIDADDLWAPEKIERQLAALAGRPTSTGLVYTWFAIIGEAGQILNKRRRHVFEGDVLERMCLGNLVGNASSALMPISVVQEMGGYDEELHQRGFPGCEDLKLYWLIAEKYPFACVPEFLTGYRVGRRNMSNDTWRMLGSYDLVMSEMEARRPDLARQFRRGRAEHFRWLLIRAARAGALRDFLRLSKASHAFDARSYWVTVARLPMHLTRVSTEDLLRRLKRLLDGRGRFIVAQGEDPAV
jgi:glycosyltransferase involved in cell wall biosynthesis